MKAKLLCLVALAAACAYAGEQDAARKLADAMAASGNATLAGGNQEKAKDFFYKALASTEECPDALYGLAKIFEKEGKTIAAGDFYVRAKGLMQQEDKPGSPFHAMLANADQRIKALNPFALRFSTYMDDYAQDIGKILKHAQDSITHEEAMTRADSLQLKSIVPPASVAWADAPAAPSATADNGKPHKPSQAAGGASSGVVPPDVESWLKNHGWSTITGTWSRKGDGVFEVTDGRLEAKKVDGTIDVIVDKGFSGSVSVFVRNSFGRNGGSYLSFNGVHYSWGSGYGMVLGGGVCKLYTPIAMGFSMNSGFEPYSERDETLPDWPKHEVRMDVSEMTNASALVYTLNGKAVKKANYKITKDGPFVIEISGTATLEKPQCAGQ